MLFLLSFVISSVSFGQAKAPVATSFDGTFISAGNYAVPQAGKYCFNSTTNTVCFSYNGIEVVLSGGAGINVPGFAYFTSAQFTSNVLISGYVSGNTPFVISSMYLNAVASAAVIGGFTLPARPYTVTDIGYYVGSPAASGAGTTTVRVSDGTNNCDFALNCASDTNTIGPKIKAGSGSCVYSASAAITVSITATTCATTQPTLKNIDIRAKLQ